MSSSPKTAIMVRPRQTSDLTTLHQIITRVHSKDGYPVEGPSPNFLDSKGTLAAFTALLDGRIVGHVLIHSPSHSLGAVAAWVSRGGDMKKAVVLGRLFVDPDARSKGLGRKLMEQSEAWASERGKTILLDVLCKDTEAIKLYEKMGWKRISNFDRKKRLSDGSYKLGGIDWPVVYYEHSM